MSDKLLTVDEAAKILEVKAVTVKRYARENLLNSVKQGNDLMFLEQDVLKYLEITKRLK
jgi:excisionase family DNA binding protein